MALTRDANPVFTVDFGGGGPGGGGAAGEGCCGVAGEGCCGAATGGPASAGVSRTVEGFVVLLTGRHTVTGLRVELVGRAERDASASRIVGYRSGSRVDRGGV
ncbi:hypothetical protein GCM10009827_068050 [Dactylosporangium maewongense]|uniref:Uncharacterized protein n=1 Tax=Dactylosporangium maewongense TaxID=634393 RepID=A0ABP4MBG0_9ACTN